MAESLTKRRLNRQKEHVPSKEEAAMSLLNVNSVFHVKWEDEKVIVYSKEKSPVIKKTCFTRRCIDGVMLFTAKGYNTCENTRRIMDCFICLGMCGLSSLQCMDLTTMLHDMWDLQEWYQVSLLPSTARRYLVERAFTQKKRCIESFTKYYMTKVCKPACCIHATQPMGIRVESHSGNVYCFGFLLGKTTWRETTCKGALQVEDEVLPNIKIKQHMLCRMCNMVQKFTASHYPDRCYKALVEMDVPLVEMQEGKDYMEATFKISHHLRRVRRCLERMSMESDYIKYVSYDLMLYAILKTPLKSKIPICYLTKNYDLYLALCDLLCTMESLQMDDVLTMGNPFIADFVATNNLTKAGMAMLGFSTDSRYRKCLPTRSKMLTKVILSNEPEKREDLECKICYDSLLLTCICPLPKCETSKCPAGECPIANCTGCKAKKKEAKNCGCRVVVMMPCQHYMCKMCMKETYAVATQAQKRPFCPFCRATFMRSDVVQGQFVSSVTETTVHKDYSNLENDTFMVQTTKLGTAGVSIEMPKWQRTERADVTTCCTVEDKLLSRRQAARKAATNIGYYMNHVDSNSDESSDDDEYPYYATEDDDETAI